MSVVTRAVRRLYRRSLRRRLGSNLNTQRLKLAWYVWGYWPLVLTTKLPLRDRLRLLRRFLRVDWNVMHGHTPFQIALIAQMLAARPARDDELFVEAGCWNGGSSAKFSLICAKLGFGLHVYDSFEGVEPMTAEQGDHDFSGEYAATEETVRANVRQFGDVTVCTLHKGWFSDTIARESAPGPVAFAYIDCDTAKGTAEVLSGLSGALTPDGRIFTQDFHNRHVRDLLSAPETWDGFARRKPTVVQHDWRLASITFGAPS